MDDMGNPQKKQDPKYKEKKKDMDLPPKSYTRPLAKHAAVRQQPPVP